MNPGARKIAKCKSEEELDGSSGPSGMSPAGFSLSALVIPVPHRFGAEVKTDAVRDPWNRWISVIRALGITNTR